MRRANFHGWPRQRFASEILRAVGKRFKLLQAEDYPRFHVVWKARLVEARRAGDDRLAALLSKFREDVKRRLAQIARRRCPSCGGSKGRTARKCILCYLPDRKKPRKARLDAIAA